MISYGFITNWSSLICEGIGGKVMRKSSAFFLVVGALAFALALAVVRGEIGRRRSATALRETADLARKLELTDLCLFTDAQYTRHPTQADLFTPFQEHPLSLEHFPSGSLIGPGPAGRGR